MAVAVIAAREVVMAVGTLQNVGETPPLGEVAASWTSGGTSMSKPQRDPTEAGWGSERGVGETSRSWSESNRMGGVPGPPVTWWWKIEMRVSDGRREEKMVIQYE